MSTERKSLAIDNCIYTLLSLFMIGLESSQQPPGKLTQHVKAEAMLAGGAGGIPPGLLRLGFHGGSRRGMAVARGRVIARVLDAVRVVVRLRRGADPAGAVRAAGLL
jgi:hypothetical protein